MFTRDSSQKTVAEVGDVGGPMFAAHEGREHQHQLARRRTDLPKAPLEKNRISYLDVWEKQGPKQVGTVRGYPQDSIITNEHTN